MTTSVVVVTGLSGAGKSTALHALEDLGFFCIDNLPTALAPDAVALCEKGGITRVALGMDVRVRAFLDKIGTVLALLEDNGRRVSLKRRKSASSLASRKSTRSCAASPN